MGEVIGETKSLCPICLSVIDAYRTVEDNNVYLVKECPEHGLFKVVVWHDAKYYKEVERYSHPKVEPTYIKETSYEEYPKIWDPSLQQQSTCLAVVEVTSGCNLKCPYCFASAGGKAQVDESYDNLRRMFASVAAQVKKPTVVQISGGEPTVRDDLPKIIAMAKEAGVDFVQLNTNGVRIGKDESYLKALKEAGVDSLYFSFDGVDKDIFIKASGVDLLDVKLKAIDNCKKYGVPMELVAKIIPGVNVNQVGKIIQFAKKNVGIIRGIHFQPLSYFGRVPSLPPKDYITIPQLLKEIEIQTNGEISPADFVPTGCSDCHCDTKCFGFVSDGKFLSLTKMGGKFTPEADITKTVREGVNDTWGGKMAKEAGLSLDGASDEECGCGTWLGLVKDLTVNGLTISAMHFQDAWNIDYDRLKRCCIHEVLPDGKFVPFCLYNATDINGQSPFRKSLEKH
ncbi:MAG: radical SAM protein [Candidatus Methanomethylicaceae archaeon]|jgi:uncharacterized radical SAM superfamily Fe-S cluster-containing enzyme